MKVEVKDERSFEASNVRSNVLSFKASDARSDVTSIEMSDGRSDEVSLRISILWSFPANFERRSLTSFGERNRGVEWRRASSG